MSASARELYSASVTLAHRLRANYESYACIDEALRYPQRPICTQAKRIRPLNHQASQAVRSASNAFDFAYKAFPWWVFPLIGTKPLNCKAFLAACTLVTQSFTRTKAFLPWALAFFDTILPRLLRIREVLVKPPTVFSLLPRRSLRCLECHTAD